MAALARSPQPEVAFAGAVEDCILPGILTVLLINNDSTGPQHRPIQNRRVECRLRSF